MAHRAHESLNLGNIKKFANDANEYQDFHDVKYIYTIDDKKIQEFMEESEIEETRWGARHWFALVESNSGKMDFTIHHLYPMIGGLFNGEWTKDELSTDKGPIFIFDNNNKSYNLYDAGNFLWGNAMKGLGFTYEDAKYWSLWNDEDDTKEDQQAIKDGYNKVVEKQEEVE